MAVHAGRAQIENGTSPGDPALLEEDISDIDYFRTQLSIVVLVLGMSVFPGRVASECACDWDPWLDLSGLHNRTLAAEHAAMGGLSGGLICSRSGQFTRVIRSRRA